MAFKQKNNPFKKFKLNPSFPSENGNKPHAYPNEKAVEIDGSEFTVIKIEPESAKASIPGMLFFFFQYFMFFITLFSILFF